jgi:hypothetical protein
LDLPLPGQYLISASVSLHNSANNLFQDNRREGSCGLYGMSNPNRTSIQTGMWIFHWSTDGARGTSVPLIALGHPTGYFAIAPLDTDVAPGRVELRCSAQGSVHDETVQVAEAVMTATKVSSLAIQ